MSDFQVGDKVVCVNVDNAEGWLVKGEKYNITLIHQNGDVAVNHINNDFGWWSKRFEIADQIGEQPRNVAASAKKTGGSTPNQYRISVNLPLTSDRTQFVDVDLEAMDVIDALDLSGNLKDVQKALFRMGKKQNTPVAYDLNKCLFYILREMKKRGTISHAKFWEVSGMLDNVLKAEDVK